MWSTGINRNIVECKGVGLKKLLVGTKVLIETLWNVKKVNSIYYFEPGGRINRNIVECKAKNLALHWLVSPRINRNIVECKEHQRRNHYTTFSSINRNIVECKDLVP